MGEARDLRKKEAASESARLTLAVASVMRRHWISASPAESIDSARQLMRLAGVRHVPVLDEGILLGMLAAHDVLIACLASAIDVDGPASASIPVAALILRDGPITSADESLADAVRRMVRAGLGCLPVVDGAQGEARMIGLLVESDLLRAAYSLAGTAGL